MITDPEEAAQDLALAAFCAMTHGRDRNIGAILDALARALNSADRNSARYYTVSRETEKTIMECTDLEKLDLWCDQALTATRVEDLFTAD